MEKPARAYSFSAFMLQFLLGLSIGAGVTGIISPTLINWWATPPFGQIGCDYSQAIAWAMNRLLMNMIIGALILGVLVPPLAYLVFYRRRKPTVPEAGAPDVHGP